MFDFRKLAGRLDAIQQTSVIATDSHGSILGELDSIAKDNAVKNKLAESYREFKHQAQPEKHRLEQVLEQVECQFGPINTRQTNVTNREFLHYLLENHRRHAFNILHTMVAVKLHQINNVRIDESLNPVDKKSAEELFALFGSFTTGNNVKVGDKVSIISLTVWGTGYNSIDIEGFITPQVVEDVNFDSVYVSDRFWPCVSIIDQLKIKKQVIIFKDAQKAEECLGALLLLGNKFRGFTIHNDISESIDEAMNPAVATASMKMVAPKVSAVATPSAPAAPNAPKAPGVVPAKPGTPATNTAAPAVNAAQTDANAEAQAAAAEPDMQLGSDKAKDLLNTVAPIMQDPAGAQQLKTLADKFKLKPGVIK